MWEGNEMPVTFGCEHKCCMALVVCAGCGESHCCDEVCHDEGKAYCRSCVREMAFEYEADNAE